MVDKVRSKSDWPTLQRGAPYSLLRSTPFQRICQGKNYLRDTLGRLHERSCPHRLNATRLLASRPEGLRPILTLSLSLTLQATLDVNTKLITLEALSLTRSRLYTEYARFKIRGPKNLPFLHYNATAILFVVLFVVAIVIIIVPVVIILTTSATTTTEASINTTITEN